MRAILMLLLGYTAYRMAMRIRDENSSPLLLTDQSRGAPEPRPPVRSRRKRAAPPPASAPRATPARKRR